jgi:hypothetical protein
MALESMPVKKKKGLIFIITSSQLYDSRIYSSLLIPVHIEGSNLISDTKISV